MLLFLVISAIIEVIKGMLKNAIGLPCDDRNASTDDCNCSSCSDLIIRPENIANQPGLLVYDVTLPTFVGPAATETIIMVADTLAAIDQGQYTFSNLLGSTYKGYAVGPFFPPQPLSTSYKANRAPFAIDLDVPYSGDGYSRTVSVKDIVIQWVENETSIHGKLTLFGGTAEDPLGLINGRNIFYVFNNGITPVVPPSLLPDPDPVIRGCTITAFKPNYDVLAVMGFTSFDCNPELINDKLAFYATMDTRTLDDFVFPDVDGAMNLYVEAIAKLRSNINDESIDEFRDTMNSIMDDLKAQTEASYSQAMQSMINPLYCTATIEPEIQFISGTIKVSAVLRNSTKQTFKEVMGETDLPQVAIDDVLAKLTAEVSFGNLSAFEYEPSTGNFISYISSKDGGDGVLKIYYDGQQFGQLVVPASLNEPSRIEQIEFNYSFISGSIGYTNEAIRRDETDTANG